MSEKKSGYSPAMEAAYGKKKEPEILKKLAEHTRAPGKTTRTPLLTEKPNDS